MRIHADPVRAAADDGVSLRLQPESRSVRTARQAVGEFCRAHLSTEQCDDARLLVSELTTNACARSSGPIGVTATADAEGVTVTVADDSSVALPRGPSVCPPPLADSGRGLFLLDSLAGSWASVSTDTGKRVWFRLP